MDERRRTPRANCRLHCRIRQGRERIRARIVDVSEGGLCILSQARFEPKTRLDIVIDVPGSGDAVVRGEVWHARRPKGRGSSRKVWSLGIMLAESDDAYHKLLHAAGVAPETPAPALPPAVNMPPAQTTRPATTRTSLPPSRPPAESSSTAEPCAAGTSPCAGGQPAEAAPEDLLDPKVFRVRVKARTGPRTRLLTLTAESEDEALALASRDLGSEWAILEVRAA